MEELGLYPEQLRGIRERLAAFEDIARALDVQATEMLTIKSLRVVTGELEMLGQHSDNAVLEHWTHHMHMAVSLLLVLCGEGTCPAIATHSARSATCAY